nr:GNAT family N-acetyltransferase [Companilactobacillus furfuricola]
MSYKSASYADAKRLYFEAFPKAERVPFFWLLLQARKQFVEFIAFYDDDKFVGMSYLISKGSLTYLFYLAVDPTMRGKGYGSQILQDLFKMYSGQRLCLGAERPDDEAINSNERRKRIEFYESNGFVLSGKIVREQSVDYVLLSHGGDFSKQEYQDLIAFYAGIFKLIFKTKFI